MGGSASAEVRLRHRHRSLLVRLATRCDTVLRRCGAPESKGALFMGSAGRVAESHRSARSATDLDRVFGKPGTWLRRCDVHGARSE